MTKRAPRLDVADPLIEKPKTKGQKAAMWIGGGLAAIAVHLVAGAFLVTVAPLLQTEHKEPETDVIEMSVEDFPEPEPEVEPEPEPGAPRAPIPVRAGEPRQRRHEGKPPPDGGWAANCPAQLLDELGHHNHRNHRPIA